MSLTYTKRKQILKILPLIVHQTEEIADLIRGFAGESSRDAASYRAAELAVHLHRVCKINGFDIVEFDELCRRIARESDLIRVPVLQPCDHSEQFAYEPLVEPKTIRVLCLHKGNPSDPLEGSLTIKPLGLSIDYDPVSYAWGVDSMPCSMLVNGCQMPLTQSLHDALRRLRRRDEDRNVWADGVCINQADDAEKSAQVAVMPEIYNQARVLVYLGVEADNSEILPEFLEALGKVDKYEISRTSISEGSWPDDLPPLNDTRWPALLTFLSRPWFKRLWVAQEVIVARDVRFLCGDWEIGWRPMDHMVSLLVDGLGLIYSTRVRDTPSLAAKVTDPGRPTFSLSMMLTLRTTRSVTHRIIEDLERRIADKEMQGVHQLDASCVSKRDFVVQACKENPDLFRTVEHYVMKIPSSTRPSRTEMLRLFTMFMSSDVTNPLDRLYALVGLSCDVNLKEFPPDYRETVEGASLRFSKTLVRKGLGMDVLYHATNLTPESASSSCKMPSWSADWTTQRSWDNHWLKLGWAYQVKGGYFKRELSGSLVSLIDNDILRVSGYQLDVCQNPVVSWQTPDRDDEISILIAQISFLRKSNVIFSGDDYFTGESWNDVQLRTLAANDEYLGPRMTDVLILMEDALAITLGLEPCGLFRSASLLSNLESCSAWLQSMTSKMKGYSTCKTSKGYVGIVPKQTVASDSIFMLKGADMPFVLRAVANRPGYYSFIGGCYIHGLMRGKAWKLDHVDTEIFLV